MTVASDTVLRYTAERRGEQVETNTDELKPPSIWEAMNILVL